MRNAVNLFLFRYIVDFRTDLFVFILCIDKANIPIGTVAMNLSNANFI
jgi:hypothetical protein